ncbi:MAG TPA: acyl carrier protein [Sandaracinaceae bacterium LLY-WYZ-13_1]|nr:acyl carrier protein [Sandaracinaceae bacterium LLY-WYZ-13_1]
MSTIERVREFITTNFYVDDAEGLSDEQSLLEAGVVDSTGVLEVIDFIEEAFEVQVEDAEMLPDNLDSIDRIARFVDRKRAAAA